MYRTAFLFLLSVLLVASQSEKYPERQEDPTAVRCAAEQNVTVAYVRSALHKNATEVDFTNPTVKCLVLCFWKTLGLAGDDGKFNMTEIVSKLRKIDTIPNPDGVIQEFTECSSEEGTNKCDTVVKGITCILQKKAFREWAPYGSPLGTNA